MFNQNQQTNLEDLKVAAMHMNPKEFISNYEKQIKVNHSTKSGDCEILFYNVKVLKNYIKNVTLVWQNGTFKETTY